MKARLKKITAAGAVALLALAYPLFAPQTLSPRIVEVRRGERLSDVLDSLKEGGALRDKALLKLWLYLGGNQSSLRAGEYRIPAGASVARIAGMLSRGNTLRRYVTIPEGLTVKQAAAVLDRAEKLSGALPKMPAEGSLLPQTYAYEARATKTELVDQMKRAMDEALAREWEARADGLPFKTPREALVLASIVEKETSLPAERTLIAGVFVGRLKRGMRLQSDPTVVYAITGGLGHMQGRRLLAKDLEVDSPYNTYTKGGLPPTPICNPGIESIRAVLNPAVTGYLYFVADGSGGHRFASTLEEHEKNRKEWRKIR